MQNLLTWNLIYMQNLLTWNASESLDTVSSLDEIHNLRSFPS